MTDQPAMSTLTLRHRIPDDWAADPWAEVRPLIDGMDVLRAVHPEAMARSRRHWTGPTESWPLAVTEDPRRVNIGEPPCTAGCCGALYVTMRREGDRVIWDDWENTSNATALPADCWFDVAQYEAELARAAADRSWEEPVDTIARLLRQTLADSGWFEQWGCVLTNVSPRREEPDMPEEFTSPEGVDVSFDEVHASGTAARFHWYDLFTTHEQPVEEQARQLAARILADDPRKTAEREEH
ncbi:hypothetical protein [Streptomyces sp. NPDC017520]|uniref:hypothetical protein n=1 Tax=Streptomyces sp. NPDC017520 TaxID=3364998 RepID=UPI0037949C2A